MRLLNLQFLPDRYDALLIANGTPPGRPLLRELLKRSDSHIALDGGLGVYFRYRFVPHHVIGDLDSVETGWINWARQNGTHIHPRPSHQEPDIAKGLRFCAQQRLNRVAVVGAAGDRTDHTLSAFHFLFQVRGVKAHLFTDSGVVLPLKGRAVREYALSRDHSISWFGIPEALGCTIEGVKWPFHNRSLRFDGFHSLSNQPRESAVTVRQRSGKSVVIISLTPQKS